jgi:hypothetical protein
MSNKTGPVAAINSDETEVRERMARGEARRKAFATWMREEGNGIVEEVGDEPKICADMANNRLVEHYLWRAFTAGERHGRAKLDSILSHGRREA